MPTKHFTKSVRFAATGQVIKLQPARSDPVPISRIWRQRLNELAAFKKKYGHCRVPVSTGDHSSLARWSVIQRYLRRKGKLSAERVRKLDELGFSWEGRGEWNQANWESMYKVLTAYRRVHGHCRVPLSTRDYADLSQWVARQRRARRIGKLSKDRVCRLDQLGFVWERFGEQWEGMLAALAKYKKAHGNCDVPRDWPANPKLANWVITQRKFNRKGRLLSERKKRLEELGFRFSSQETVRKCKVKSRQTFQTAFGPIADHRRMVVVGAKIILPK